jgi:hypothetical protein
VKFEHIIKGKTKNKTGRIIVSMTPYEAAYILAGFKHRRKLAHAEFNLQSGLLDSLYRIKYVHSREYFNDIANGRD